MLATSMVKGLHKLKSSQPLSLKKPVFMLRPWNSSAQTQIKVKLKNRTAVSVLMEMSQPSV